MLGTLCAGSTRTQFVPDQVVAQVRLCAYLLATRLTSVRVPAVQAA